MAKPSMEHSTRVLPLMSGQAPTTQRVSPMVQERRAIALMRKVSGTSVLAGMAVSDPVQKDYEKRLQAFEEWARANQLTVTYSIPSLLEPVILEYFDHLYLEHRKDSTHGPKLLAALGFQYPQYRQLPKTILLPTVMMALQGWLKAHPGRTRDPLPAAAVLAIAADLIQRGFPLMARAVVSTRDTYLRPGEALGLIRESVVPSAMMAGNACQGVCLLLHLASQR